MTLKAINTEAAKCWFWINKREEIAKERGNIKITNKTGIPQILWSLELFSAFWYCLKLVNKRTASVP